MQHEKASKVSGVKPLFGIEAYTAPADMRETKNQRKWHLTILAADQEGYINLNQLVSRSWAEGFYRWPTVTGNILKDNQRGLIVLSGCSDSLLACTLLGGKGIPEPIGGSDVVAAYKVASRFKEMLGDRYYLEVQQFPELERTRTLNHIYAQMSKDLKIPLVASSDCHYPYPDDNEMQKILHSASRNTGTVAAAEAEWEYDIRLTFPSSDKAIIDRLVQTGLSRREAGAAVHMTAEIADRCNVVLPKSEQIRFPLPAGFVDTKTLLWKMLRDGWAYRWARNAHMRKHKKEYWDKTLYEMDLVVMKDYCDYFAMLSDCVIWAKEHGIPVGPARGSAAASLVCYLLRITEVDPMQFPTMMFERFIDAKREDLPDVDLDFADDRRDEVRLHLVDLYGADHVGNIGNFTRYRGKNAINDVARVYRIPKWESSIINDLVIERSGGDSRFDASLGDTRDMFPAAAAVFERHPEFEYAIRLEGNYKAMGVHAAGLVVSNKPITDTCAMYERNNVGKSKKTVNVIAYDKKDAEYLGMLKADFLGLSTMGMISKALGFIGMELDALYQIPLDDPETIAAFKRADVIGIFQYEGRATRLMTMDVKPNAFMEIADINALSRPGPLFSGASATYVDIKYGRKQPEHLHPIVDKWTASSQYQIIYQEQVLGIIREMGGFPVAMVADIRKIISQKLGEASFNAMREEFVKGAKAIHGVPEKESDHIWKLMVTSATYSFCCTGDTVVERAGAGPHNVTPEITIAELYANQESKTPIGDKMRYGKGVRLLAMSDDGRVRPERLLRVHHPIKYRIVKITTDTGRSIRVSADHRLLTEHGYKHAMELAPGDLAVVMLPKEKPQPKGSQQLYKGWDGMAGAGNPAYIDGRDIALHAAHDAVRVRSGNRCEWCNLESDGKSHTLEFAHIATLQMLDGDYLKCHTVDNILHLCNPCHKKFDYSKGERVVRWTRGRPTGLERIASVEDDGYDLIYELSMEGPAHNYIGNGFCNHNNIAHCVSYAMLGFWAMWLKVHHPLAFYAAQLSKIDQERWQYLIKDAERHGVEVLPPDIKSSDVTWKPLPDKHAVLAGLTQVPGIADKNGATIMAWLAGKDAAGIDRSTLAWADMIEIKGIGPKTVARIQKWADSDDPFKLYYAEWVLGALREQMKQRRVRLPLSPTYTSDEIPREADNLNVTWMGIPKFREYKDYIEDERARSGKPLDEIMAAMDRPDLVKGCVVKCYDDGDEEVYLRFNRFNFPKFKDMLEGIKIDGSQVVIAQGMKRAGFGINLQVKKLIVIDVDEEEDESDAPVPETD